MPNKRGSLMLRGRAVPAERLRPGGCLVLRLPSALPLPFFGGGWRRLLELDREVLRVAQLVRLCCEASEFGRELGLTGWGGYLE